MPDVDLLAANGRLPFRDPLMDARCQDVERKRPLRQHHVVEGADVEPRAQRLARPSVRSALIFSSPILYASACPGQAM